MIHFYSNMFIKHLFLTVLFFVLSTNIPAAQKKSKDGLREAALNAVAGKDRTKKNGPLAKVGFELALLKEEYNAHNQIQSFTPFTPSNSLLRISNQHVVVDVVAHSDAVLLENDLRALGMQVTGRAGSMVSGLLPISAIEFLAGLHSVRFARPSLLRTSVGLTTSQADSAMRSDDVRRTLGYNGEGITIGVLSDSYDRLGGASADVLSGDLPGVGNPNGYTTPVDVLQDDNDPGNTDEGRAMLQLVHDIAPGANLAFATAFLGQASFANNITNLRTTGGANIIVDDVIYYAEPMFQDGIIAQAVDSAVAAGVSYFSSAGNSARRSYESVWRSGPVLDSGSIAGGFLGGTTFDFDSSSGVDYLQSFTLGPSRTIYIAFQWDSPFASVCSGCPGSPNDLDLYLLNSAGNQILYGSVDDNIDGDAFEFFYLTNTSTIFTYTFNIMIVKYSGDNPGFIKYVNLGNAQGSLQYATNSSTIYGHANAAGAEAVGAAAFYNTPEFGISPPVKESFSSAGPTAILYATDGTPTYDARADKPEITAPDRGNTTFFGSDISQDTDTYPNFAGTSAAAPHAAAVAALMLNKYGAATPSEIYAALEGNAIDMDAAGFDNNTGFGLIQADAAMEDLLPVELIQFTAKAKEKNVELKWITATETNNHGFEIERRTVGHAFLPVSQTRKSDLPWEKIGFVEGNGTSSTEKYYSFVDVNASGKVSYRLKQLDRDGKFEYSQEVEIVISKIPKMYALMQNYPNPFNPSTEIHFSLPVRGLVSLKVFDILGKEIASLVNEVKEVGVFTAEFSARNIPSGVYFYTLHTGNFTATKKMVVLK